MSKITKSISNLQTVLNEQQSQQIRSAIPEMPSVGDPMVALSAQKRTAKGRASTILTDTATYSQRPQSSPQVGVKPPPSIAGVPNLPGTDAFNLLGKRGSVLGNLP